MSSHFLPADQIRLIWQDLKQLDRLQKNPINTEADRVLLSFLFEKFERVNILFGHESTLDRAIIYYLDQQK